MKNKKIIIILLFMIQMVQVFTNIAPVNAQITNGDEITLFRRS